MLLDDFPSSDVAEYFTDTECPFGAADAGLCDPERLIADKLQVNTSPHQTQLI